MTELTLDLFTSQVEMNYFEYEPAKLAPCTISQHYIQFNDYIVYDLSKYKRL